ncbi:MAG TPA: hypothetical protein VF135_12020 [Terriglobales bacterium]
MTPSELLKNDPVFVITFVVLAVGMILVTLGTLTRNRWGINLDDVYCQHCHRKMPQNHTPMNLTQTLWGGGTCDSCGCEMDKWGREIR